MKMLVRRPALFHAVLVYSIVERTIIITSKNTKKGLQIVSESFIKWLGENEHLSVKIFKQIIANYDRIRV